MCYEDVKEGLRRYARFTADPTTGTVLRANKQRVGIRLMSITTNATDGSARLSKPNTADRGCLLYVNAGNPRDEVWLERHGTSVQDELVLFVNGNCAIVEFLNSELDHPPAPGNPYDSVSRSK